MELDGIPFDTINWSNVEPELHKGHIILCLEGELHTELKDGRHFVLKPGMGYHVADHAEPHRSSAPTGAKLYVVD